MRGDYTKHKTEDNMITQPQSTWGAWVTELRKQHNIKGDTAAFKKTGMGLTTLKRWEEGVLPNLRSILILVKYLSKTTGENPQDILCAIMESIPKWRDISK